MDILTGILVILGNFMVSTIEAIVVYQIGKHYGAIGRDEAYSLRDSAMDAIAKFDQKFGTLKTEIEIKIDNVLLKVDAIKVPSVDEMNVKIDNVLLKVDAIKVPSVDEMNAKQAEADAFMRSYLDDLQKQIKKMAEADIKLSPEDITEIGKTLSLSLRGAAGAEKQKVTKEMQEQYMATLTPEQVEAMENAQFRKKVQEGILKLLPGSDD